MSLRERLNEDLKSAMRAKDAARMAVIRGIKAAVLQAETRGERITLDDAGIFSVIVKEVKERQDAILEFERGARPDLVDKLLVEMEILKAYLPDPLSPLYSNCRRNSSRPMTPTGGTLGTLRSGAQTGVVAGSGRGLR